MKKTYLCCKTEYTICHNCNICLHVTRASSGPLCIHSSFTLVKSKLQDEKEQQLLYWHLNVENQYHSNEILAASNFFYFLCTSSSKRKHRNTKHFIWLKFDSPQGDERINNIPQLQSNLRHKAGRTVLKAMHYKANKVKHTVNLILLWTALKTK